MANRDGIVRYHYVDLVEEGDTQERKIADTNESVYWSMEEGGCEGMHKITADGTSKTDIVGISSTDAEGRLAEYEGTSDDFPSAKCVRLRNTSLANNTT